MLERFDKLPFKNKVAFVDKIYPQFKSTCYLSGFSKVKGVKNIYATQYLDGRRYIDQFDYVSFINQLNQLWTKGGRDTPVYGYFIASSNL